MDNMITKVALGQDSLTLVFESDISIMDATQIVYSLASDYELKDPIPVVRANITKRTDDTDDEE